MRLLVAAMMSALGIAAARAETPTSWVVDPARTVITFDAKTTFHPFEGTAPHASGQVIVAQGLPTAGFVDIPVGELRTGWDARDQDMRGPKYLDTTKFPSIHFLFTSFDGPVIPAQGQVHGTLHGKLRVRDQEKALDIPVTYGMAEGRLEVSGSFPLDIRDVGLPVPIVFLVQKMDPAVTVHFLVGFAGR